MTNAMQADRAERIALANAGLFGATIVQIEDYKHQVRLKEAMARYCARVERSNATFTKEMAEHDALAVRNAKTIKERYIGEALSHMLAREAKYSRLRAELSRGEATARCEVAKRKLNRDTQISIRMRNAAIRFRTGTK